MTDVGTSRPAPPSTQDRVGAGLRRLLTLREGSIVVVTILAIVYFSVLNGPS